MSIAQTIPTLTEEQRESAWQTAFAENVDLLPDEEVSWEGEIWRRLGVEAAAAICRRILRERRADDFVLPGSASARDLDLLWRGSDRVEALRMARDQGQSLLTAMRILFWTAR